jgi:hypothetical protein
MLAAIHGRDIKTSDAEMALDAQGKVLALRYHTQANVGAYATPTGCAIQLLIGPWVTTSIYDIPHDRPEAAGGAHQHAGPTGAVPRRRTPRGHLQRRAAVRRRCAPAEHRPVGAPRGAT